MAENLNVKGFTTIAMKNPDTKELEEYLAYSHEDAVLTNDGSSLSTKVNGIKNKVDENTADILALETEVDTKEPLIATKGTAFNKDFGTTAGTVAQGNHAHDMSPYQTITDDNITGTDKNIVNAINSNTDKIDILNDTVINHITNHPSVGISGYGKSLSINGNNLSLKDENNSILNTVVVPTGTSEIAKINDTLLKIKTYDADDYQAVHPKVLYFENGWNGFRWWMAYTPYTGTVESVENPSIACSNDMINWYEPLAGLNPLHKPADNSSRHNSDTHLVYNSVENELECWWRNVLSGSTGERIMRRRSADGKTWGDVEIMHDEIAPILKSLSPAILFDENKYKIWCVYRSDDTQTGVIKYYESDTGDNWQYIRDIYITSTVESYIPWHIDIIKTQEGYELFNCATNGYDWGNKMSLLHAKSSDNITYSGQQLIIEPGDKIDFNTTKIYRGSGVKIGNDYYIFYSFADGNNWGLSVVKSNNGDVSSLQGINELEKLQGVVYNQGLKIYNLETKVEYLLNNINTSVESVKLNKNTHTLMETEELQLIATITPSIASNQTITWTSSDNTLATVNSNGLVRALKAGTATITATTEDGNKTDTCVLTINAQPAGLVMWLDGTTGSDPQTTWTDKTGNGNNALLTNFTFDGTTNGWIDNGLKFAKTTSPSPYAEIVQNMDWTGDWSIDLEIETSNISVTQAIFNSFGTIENMNEGYFKLTLLSGGLVEAFVYKNANSIKTLNYETGERNKIILKKKGLSMTFKVNSQVETYDISSYPITENIKTKIGCPSYSYDNDVFKGTIYYIKAYNYFVDEL